MFPKSRDISICDFTKKCQLISVIFRYLIAELSIAELFRFGLQNFFPFIKFLKQLPYNKLCKFFPKS